MPAIKRDLSSPDNVKIEIDLNELFGDSIADRPAARQALAQDIIDTIVNNSEDGIGVSSDLRKHVELRKPYSTGYQDSQEFKAFEKSKNKVNMTLTGSMLSSIDLVEESKNKLVIGFSNELDSQKAHGHITGKDGAAPKMKRDFFGVTQKELKEIASNYASDFETAPKESLTVADILKIIGAGRRLFG